MRTELMGNIANFKRELEALHARKEQYSRKQQSQKGSKSKDKIIVLSKTDRLGNVRLAEFDHDS